MKNHLGLHQFVLGSLLFVPASSDGASIIEDIVGDISDLPTAPTILTLTEGPNTVSANFLDLDDDFFTLIVPNGTALTSITLLSYNHPLLGNESFLGYQTGSTLNEAPADLERGEISFILIGEDDRGMDITSRFSENPSSASASFPLLSGSYAFWLNETDDLPASVSLNFELETIPEPHTTLLLILPAAIFLQRKRN